MTMKKKYMTREEVEKMLNKKFLYRMLFLIFSPFVIGYILFGAIGIIILGLIEMIQSIFLGRDTIPIMEYLEKYDVYKEG
jgi:hypothetical protein